MRIPQESQENPPAVNGAATVPTHVRVSDIAEQIRQQSGTIQQEFDRLQNQLVQNHNAMLARCDTVGEICHTFLRYSEFVCRLDSLPIIGANSAASQQVVASIARVKYAQDAAVLGYLVARWTDPTDGSIKMKELGPYKAVGTRQEFNLVDEGLPDGATVRFSSYVAGVGEYENELWFKISGSESHGATFRQTGTAFKGWFQYTGLYCPFIAHDDFQVGVMK
ncbi:hypothetical protein B0H14DRAFT_659446 [Mycena olivaceomarginata]|nr:hypothetical protein B0H14DRAFT_659446 [Mycena olivaceomarginata]